MFLGTLSALGANNIDGWTSADITGVIPSSQTPGTSAGDLPLVHIPGVILNAQAIDPYTGAALSFPYYVEGAAVGAAQPSGVATPAHQAAAAAAAVPTWIAGVPDWVVAGVGMAAAAMLLSGGRR